MLLRRSIAAMAEHGVGVARSRAWLNTSLGLIVASAVGIMGEEYRLRSSWPPASLPFSGALPFVTPGIAHASEGLLIISVMLCIWSLAYIALLKASWGDSSGHVFPVKIFSAQAVVLFITLFSSLPFNSDQYAYVGHSELVRIGENPYAPPLTIVPLPEQLHAIGTVWSLNEGSADARQRIMIRSRYGPVWTSLSFAALYPFGGYSIETKARVLRALAALAALACSPLLWLAVRHSVGGTAAFAAYTLSPAIVLQTADGAHNDIIALFFALACVILFNRRRWLFATISFAACVGTKLTFSPFLPAFFVLVMVRHGLTRAATAVIAFGVVLAAFALPYGVRESLLQPIADVRRFNVPYVAGVAERGLHRLPGLHPSTSQLATLYVALTLACALAIALFAFQRRRIPSLEAATLLGIFCGAHFEPWYAIILVPLLMIPSPWAVPLFAGVSLATQLFALNEFLVSYGDLPLVQFLVLAVLLIFVLKLYLAGRKSLPITRARIHQVPA